jgi:hypothetical protein
MTVPYDLGVLRSNPYNLRLTTIVARYEYEELLFVRVGLLVPVLLPTTVVLVSGIHNGTYSGVRKGNVTLIILVTLKPGSKQRGQQIYRYNPKKFLINTFPEVLVL